MPGLIQALAFVVTLLGCVGCDQSTKTAARAYLPRNEVVSFAGEIFILQYAENKGAFLGVGAALPEGARELVFKVGVSAVVVCILCVVLFGSVLSHPVTIALSLLASGGLGNLIDRLAHGGYVVDFLNIGVAGFRTGIFNIADVAILAGACILFRSSLKQEAGNGHSP